MKVKDHSARLKKGPRRALPIRPPWCALHAYPLFKITGRCKQVTSLLDCFVTYLYQLKKTCEERDTCLAFLFHYQSVYSTEAPGGQYQTSPLKKNPKGTFYNFIDVTLVQMIVKWDNVDWLMRGWSYVPYLCTILIGHSDIIDGWSLKK